jgi:hypothetical protein
MDALPGWVRVSSDASLSGWLAETAVRDFGHGTASGAP